tara:strand:- start:161549 stop:161878 length:330 start_codon:yes stop_codon:yes gene_type:complete
MEKRNINDLQQAEDRDLNFVVTIDYQPVLDVAKILFVVMSDDGETEILKITMGEFATFADSAINVRLSDIYTTDMVGKYDYELWFQDSLGKDVPAAYGTLKFTATFGRY